MYQIAEQTHDEKVDMYMKLSKKQIIGMLIECNRIISTHLPSTMQYAPCDHAWHRIRSGKKGLIFECKKCMLLKRRP